MGEKYAQARVAVDAVLFTTKNNQLYVYLNQREKEPFLKQYELIGGLLGEGESAEETVQRKLSSNFQKKDIFLEQFFTFTLLDRDPRYRTISIGFVALLPSTMFTSLQGWFLFEDLPSLAFDHAAIILQAKQYLKNIVSPRLVARLLPEFFPLNQLQKIYELIEEEEYDNRNFRKKILASGLVKETEKKEDKVSHRPAKLFRFTF